MTETDQPNYARKPPPEFTVLKTVADYPSTATTTRLGGWKRVSTRQWVKSVRMYVKKYQTFPYKTLVNGCFCSCGYYPDLIDPNSYKNYVDKYPPSAKRHSVNSDEDPPDTHYTDTDTSATTRTVPVISTTSVSVKGEMSHIETEDSEITDTHEDVKTEKEKKAKHKSDLLAIASETGISLRGMKTKKRLGSSNELSKVNNERHRKS